MVISKGQFDSGQTPSNGQDPLPSASSPEPSFSRGSFNVTSETGLPGDIRSLSYYFSSCQQRLHSIHGQLWLDHIISFHCSKAALEIIYKDILKASSGEYVPARYLERLFAR
jgi:hypothetical protein